MAARHLGRGARLHRREDAGDPCGARRRGGGVRARHLDQQQPRHLPARQRVRQPQRHLGRLFLLRAARRRVQGNGRRQAFGQAVGHGRDLRLLQQPRSNRRMGLAEAHQQRPRPDRPHADDPRAQARPGQHHRRSAQARGRRQGRHLAAPAPRHRRRHGARMDERHHRRGALRQGVRGELVPRLRGAEGAGEGVPGRQGRRHHLVQRRRHPRRSAALCAHQAGHHRLGQRHRPARHQHVPGDARAVDPHGHHRQPRRAGRQLLLAGAAAQLSRAVGPPVSRAGGEAARRGPNSRRST